MIPEDIQKQINERWPIDGRDPMIDAIHSTARDAAEHGYLLAMHNSWTDADMLNAMNKVDSTSTSFSFKGWIADFKKHKITQK